MAQEYINKTEVLAKITVQEGTTSIPVSIPANTSFVTISAIDHDRIVITDKSYNALMIVPATSTGTSVHSFIKLPISDMELRFRVLDKSNGDPATITITVTRFYAG